MPIVRQRDFWFAARSADNTYFLLFFLTYFYIGRLLFRTVPNSSRTFANSPHTLPSGIPLPIQDRSFRLPDFDIADQFDDANNHIAGNAVRNENVEDVIHGGAASCQTKLTGCADLRGPAT